jgi:hypothetical protein
MVKHLVKIGETYGVVIDQAILELLEITPDTPLKISTDGKRLYIERLDMNETRRVRPSFPDIPEDPLLDPDPEYGFPKKQPW